jgi:hypothetical protein
MTYLPTARTRTAIFIASIFSGLLLGPPTLADSARIIELIDGTRIHGEILSFDRGVFVIRSETLGRVSLHDEQIRAIRSASAQPGNPVPRQTAPSGSADPQRLSAIENRILNDPNMLSMVMTLQQDPQVMTILNDPELMRAVAAGDLQALQNNPKILGLEQNSTIQQLLQLVGRR